MALRVKMRKLADLRPYSGNPRSHAEPQIEQIVASIREFGWTVPILIDSEDGIIAGHARAMAAERLGMTEVPTILLADLTEDQKRAYVIADNKLTENSYWDNAVLARELEALHEADFDLLLTGFSQGEIDFLLDPPVMNGESPNVTSEPKKEDRLIWLLAQTYHLAVQLSRDVPITKDAQAILAEARAALAESSTKALDEQVD